MDELKELLDRLQKSDAQQWEFVRLCIEQLFVRETAAAYRRGVEERDGLN